MNGKKEGRKKSTTTLLAADSNSSSVRATGSSNAAEARDKLDEMLPKQKHHH